VGDSIPLPNWTELKLQTLLDALRIDLFSWHGR
jgi:hypothetical protein